MSSGQCLQASESTAKQGLTVLAGLVGCANHGAPWGISMPCDQQKTNMSWGACQGAGKMEWTVKEEDDSERWL